MKRIGVLGSGVVGQVLADGFLKHGHAVMRGTREPAKLADWQAGAGACASAGTLQHGVAFGNALMVNPKLAGGPPTMFICGSAEAAKADVRGILTTFGWATEDMGSVEAARAIEPLCMLWCIPGFRQNRWTHAFKLIEA